MISRVTSLSFICDLHDITCGTVSVVDYVLRSSIGQSHRVLSHDVACIVPYPLLPEFGEMILVVDVVLEGKGGTVVVAVTERQTECFRDEQTENGAMDLKLEVMTLRVSSQSSAYFHGGGQSSEIQMENMMEVEPSLYWLG